VNDAELNRLYERLYFHELDARDKIHARLQVPLTLLLAIVGAVVFLFQNFDYQTRLWSAPRVAFAFFFVSGTVILVIAAIWFVKALYNNAYYFLPDSKKTAEYKLLLQKTYEPYENKNQLVSEALERYIRDYYVEYAAFNTQVNDRRSAYIHLCNGALVAAALLFVFAYLLFYFGDLDKGRLRTEVFIAKPIEVKILDRK